MKLIKIGSSQSCDIVLNSQYVSSLHAEMTILDDGQIILEDKNSRNGTTVGNKKIEPGKEVSVLRGDRITFADTPLVWAKVPVAEKLSAYETVYNIGSNYRNEIILNSQTVSRFHASVRIAKDKKAYIHDNGSRNGTMLNGVKIASNKDIRIKKGDNIVCGTEDISDQIASIIPKPNIFLLYILAGIACTIALIGIIYAFWPDPNSRPVNPSQYRNTVVYVGAQYHYVIKFEDNPMPDTWNGTIDDIAAEQPYSGTAFFLDRNGYMATNRHVAVPWDYRDDEEDSYIRKIIEYRLSLMESTYYKMIQGETNSFTPEMIAFTETPLFNAIYKHIKKYNNQVSELVNVITHLQKSHYTITGEMDYIMVGYAGRNYTHLDELQRCVVVADSKTKDLDIALLQLNDKKTPEDVQYVFSPDNFYTERLMPLKDKLYTIGYPRGLSWALDKKVNSLEPGIKETKCSKEPSKYDFELQEQSVGGSSGSPVFNEYGQLVGVLWGGTSVAGGFTLAVQAKYLKKMYDEEVVQ